MDKTKCSRGSSTGSNNLKSNKDPLRILLDREIGGRKRQIRTATSPQVFHKLPGRLAFNLSSLVDNTTLQDGHVFLGFTKNGQYMLSYTHCVEADEHTAYPIYVYRLQWWRFIPYRRLRKVAEIRLFGEEEIQQDVFLIVSEWPNDSTRIVIHGYCAPNDNEEKHQCYVTITAVPAIDPCEDCNQLAILQMNSRYQYESPPRCLNHAYTVHTKYDLAPPYPSYCPKVFLKIDGVVILNTGDSLIALSSDIEDNHGGFGFGLFSPRVVRTMSSIDSVGSRSEDQISFDSHGYESAREHLDLLGRFIASSPNSNLTVYRSPPTPKDATNVPSGVLEASRPLMREHRTSSQGKENQNLESVLSRSGVGSPSSDPVTSPGNTRGNPSNSDATTPRNHSVLYRGGLRSPSPEPVLPGNSRIYGGDTKPVRTAEMSPPHTPRSFTDSSFNKTLRAMDMSPPGTPRGSAGDGGVSISKAIRSMDVYNFEASSTPKKEEDTSEYFEVTTDSSRGSSTVRTSLAYPPQGARMSTQRGDSKSAQEINLNTDNSTDTTHQSFEKPQLPPSHRLSNNNSNNPVATHSNNTHSNNKDNTCVTPTKSMGSLSLIPPPPVETSFNLAKGLCSPGCKYDTSSTCSSCISAPIILQSDSQCFTYSVRRYVEAYGVPGDGPIDVEDDLNLAYHSVLPLEVHGAHNCQMRLLTKQFTAPQMPCIVVKQLTLDIEHYLGETLRTKADWGSRYLAFTNYDVQIIDVCPETHEVVALVFVLIRARPPKDPTKPYIHGRSVPRLYQSGLKLVWNLKTGAYNTVAIDDLTEVNQADFIRRRKQWHPGNKVCEQLYRKYAVPQLFSRSVNVLTNEPVFKGQSLKMLLDRQNYVAILL